MRSESFLKYFLKDFRNIEPKFFEMICKVLRNNKLGFYLFKDLRNKRVFKFLGSFKESAELQIWILVEMKRNC